ncbi:hypothetical protein O3M35_006171 [Rhynocoris fuscipes]|uniref:C2H2-type domain-containing protein n=1 Tax=Rhynocoris fuscipes TaxID=488301 RepID=A0AAW1DHM5_9HEMI
MAFGSESEESEGIATIFSKSPIQDLDTRCENKSAAYWKSKENQENDGKKKHCCMVKGCNASFSRPWRLKAHLTIHVGKKPYPCDVSGCDKGYTSVYHLRRHKASVHESSSKETPSFKCEYEGCTAQFKTRQNAKKHFKRTHEGRQCKECGKIFTKRSQLITHQYEHTGVIPFKCPTCNAGFLRGGELRRHQRSHKEHVCPEKDCFLAFKTWTDVRKHLISRPRNYICILCRKSYPCRKNLKEHIHKHSIDPDYYKKRKTKLEKYQCEQCFVWLVGKASLRRHISVIHEGNPGQGKKSGDSPKVRAPRKDKGSVKKSMATLLTKVDVPLAVDKELLNRNGDDLIVDDSLIKSVLQFDTPMQMEHPENVEEDSVEEPL